MLLCCLCCYVVILLSCFMWSAAFEALIFFYHVLWHNYRHIAKQHTNNINPHSTFQHKNHKNHIFLLQSTILYLLKKKCVQRDYRRRLGQMKLLAMRRQMAGQLRFRAARAQRGFLLRMGGVMKRKQQAVCDFIFHISCFCFFFSLTSFLFHFLCLVGYSLVLLFYCFHDPCELSISCPWSYSCPLFYCFHDPCELVH